MTDVFTTQERSAVMRNVRGRDTRPEIQVRSLTHGLGYRFRVCRCDLPGKPDLVFVSRRKVIFVHGCFWHGHRGCVQAERPSSNTDYWHRKLDRNIARDRRNAAALRRGGWCVLVVWECQTRDKEALARRIRRFLG